MAPVVASRWYETKTLTDDVVWINEPHLHSNAGGNIWFIEGTEQCLVFDTGTGLGDLASVITTLTDKPVTAIASTGYYDHAGGLHQFERRAVHQQEAARVRNPTPRNTVSDKYLKQSSLTAMPYVDFVADEHVMCGCEPTLFLKDGDRMEIGDRCLEVIHTPGITNGSICLYEDRTGLLFSGESLSDGDPLYVGEPAEECSDASNRAHRTSMERLRSLGVSTVCPGHRSPFDAFRLKRILSQYLDIA